MGLLKKLLLFPRWIKNNLYLFLYKHSFKQVGQRSRIINPLQIDGKENISVGNDVIVNEGAWLAAMPLTGREVHLVLSDRVCLGHHNHIYATESIVIEKDVLTADRVYISDNIHGYEDITTPIIKQPIKQCKKVVIGEGSWLGENVCVIGSKIGKHCVIGANAVVTRDIPDYSVAVGAPAKVIKYYSKLHEKWERVEPKENQ